MRDETTAIKISEIAGRLVIGLRFSATSFLELKIKKFLTILIW